MIKIDAAFMSIFTGDPSAQTTPFGGAVSHVAFKTGSDALKDLESSLFVGSARFVVEEGGFYIETKVSRVVG